MIPVNPIISTDAMSIGKSNGSQEVGGEGSRRLTGSRRCLAAPVLLAGCALLIATGCKPAQKSAPETPDFVVLQTGRLRGNVYPDGYTGGAPLPYCLKIAAYIRSVREELARTSTPLLVVDLGDSLGGSFAAHATGSRNMVDFFNLAGYDAVALGNLDADIPESALRALAMPVLSPFMNEAGEAIPAGIVKNGVLLSKAGIEVRLASNFYGDLDPTTTPQRFPRWFGGAAAVPRPVRDYSTLFAGKTEGALNILSWMKFEPSEKAPEQFLGHLRTNSVDLILAHRIYSASTRDVWTANNLLPWNPPVVQNILRENRGFTISKTAMKRDPDGWRVLEHELIPVSTLNLQTDAALAAALNAHAQAITSANRPLGLLPKSMEDGDLLPLALRALARHPEAQLVLYSSDSIRDTLPAGELTAAQLYQCFPWDSPLAVLEITPEQIPELSKLSNISGLIRTAPPAGNIRVLAGRFHATLAAEHLGIAPGNIRTLPEAGEFAFLRDALASDLQGLLAGDPEGWQPLHDVKTEALVK